MTMALTTRSAAALRRAAARAALAPSVHNTQPWRFVVDHSELEIYADYARQLRVLDPTCRQLIISCGCALFNTRVSLAHQQYDAHVKILPDAASTELLATVTATPTTDGVVDPLAMYDSVVELRRSNRRRFADEEVPIELVEALQEAAEAEGATLVHIHREEHRLALARLTQEADRVQLLDPAYRAELRAWTTDEPLRRDGVQAAAVPHVDGNSTDEIPIRDFDTRGSGQLPAQTRSSRNQCLLLLGTDTDDVESWLAAGQALERVWLEIARRGYTASPLTQVVEIPVTRAGLRSELELTMQPHVLLRVGRAPATPASRRRRLSDVLLERQ